MCGGASAAGALFKSIGTAVKMTEADAQTRRNDERLMEQEQTATALASDAEYRGGIIAGAARQKGAQLMAQQRAAYSASGVDAGTGTAADTQVQTAILSEHDANTITADAAREAWGFKRSALDISRKRVDAQRQNSQATGAGALSILSDFGSALGGGGSGDNS